MENTLAQKYVFSGDYRWLTAEYSGAKSICSANPFFYGNYYQLERPNKPTKNYRMSYLWAISKLILHAFKNIRKNKCCQQPE